MDEEPLEPDQPRLRRILGWVRDIGAVALLGFAGLMAFGMARAPDLPDQAPGFALQDVHGQDVSLSDFAGQTVVLNFWATWCGPCRMEAPTFAAFARAHPDIPVLGIAVDGPPAKVRRSAEELGMTYPILMADEAVVEAYGIGIYPTTVVVNADGSVRWAHAGLMLRPQLALATGVLW